MKATKDEYGRPHPNFGPEIVGSAATPRAPRWFGNLFHAALVPPEQESAEAKKSDHMKDEGQFTLFLKEHYDPAIPNIPFKAKMRTSYDDAGKIPMSILATEESVTEFLDLLFNL